jgi:signal transduction histidine kinase
MLEPSRTRACDLPNPCPGLKGSCDRLRRNAAEGPSFTGPQGAIVGNGLKTVRGQLLAVVLIMGVPLLALLAYLWFTTLQDARAQALGRLRGSVAASAAEVERLRVRSGRIAAYLAGRPDILRMRGDACRSELAALRGMHPEYLNLVLFDLEGRPVCSVLPMPDRYPVFAEPPRWAADALAAEGGTLSDVAPGRIAGRPIAFFAQRLKRPDGTVVGILTLPIGLEYFNELLERQHFPAGAALGILDREGVFIGRVPEGGMWAGKASPGFEVVSTAPRIADGVVALYGVDGVKRNYLFSKLPQSGWTAFAALPDEVLFAPLYRRIAGGIAAAFLVIALSLLLAWAIARRITRPLALLTSAARAVAAGERGARAAVPGGDEISQVARQFDSMLDALSSADASLRESNRRLTVLSRRILRAEEDERRRIARDLHDQVGQSLTALELDLQALKRGSPDAARIVRCLEIAAHLHENVRDLSVLLRPPQLDDLGLVAALRAHLDRHVRPHGVQTRFEADISAERLSGDLEAACFRIAQEALNNVLRHAHARAVAVVLREMPAELVLEVGDDGAGFDPASALEAAAGGLSSGLLNMQDRAALAGGALEIESAPGKGTLLRARFALRPLPVLPDEERAQ